MDIYDAAGNPVTDYQPDMGRLIRQTRIHHHDAVAGVAEQGHWEVIREYAETGGKDVEWIVDVPGVKAQEAYDEEEEYFLFVPFTEAELTQLEREAQRPSLEARLQALEMMLLDM